MAKTVVEFHREQEQEKLRRLKKQKTTKILLIIVSIGILISGAAVIYFYTSLSWSDEKWYDHAYSLLDKSLKETEYWSYQESVQLETADYDYDYGYLELVSADCDRIDDDLQINFSNQADELVRLDYDQYDMFYLQKYNNNYYLFDDNSYSDTYMNCYVSDTRPVIYDVIEQKTALGNIIMTSPEVTEVVYNDRYDFNERALSLKVNPSDIPASLKAMALKESFGDANASAIFENAAFFIDLEDDKITSWTFEVSCIGENYATIYSLRYYLYFDEAYINTNHQNAIKVSDWNTNELILKIRPLNYLDNHLSIEE